MFCNLAARGVATYNGTLLLLRCYGVRTMFVSPLPPPRRRCRRGRRRRRRRTDWRRARFAIR